MRYLNQLLFTRTQIKNQGSFLHRLSFAGKLWQKLMLNRSLIFAILILTFPSLFAQIDNCTHGYIILETRDTIYGKLKDLTSERSCLKIKFIDSNGKKRTIKKKKVFAYLRGQEFYVKRTFARPFYITGNTGYMKVIDDGKIKLYKFNYAVKNGYFNSDETWKIEEIILEGLAVGLMSMGGNSTYPDFGYSYYQDYYLERNGQQYLIRDAEFKYIIVRYISDNIDLVKKIKNDELNFDHIESIVQAYNESYRVRDDFEY